MGPEQQRLMDRLFNDPTRKLRNFSITPGDKVAIAEELCASVNKAMDEVERKAKCAHPNKVIWFYRDDDIYMRCEDCGSRWVEQ